MRLYLLPISTRRALIYCQRLNQQTSTQTGYVDKITTRAADTWAKWEKYEKGWQKKVTVYGNKAMQRIPFEEWGLKSIPPLSARRKEEEMKGSGAVDVVYPSNVMKEQDIPKLLTRLGTERQAFHQKRAWWSIVAMPFTAPVAILPVIPNLPFFYLVYRSWSHFKALNGSKHLVFLVENNLLKPSSLPALEKIYSAQGLPRAFDTTPPDSLDKAHPDEELLLDESSHTAVAEALDHPELATEVERAVQQVRKAINAHKELVEEKRELEKNNSNTSSDDESPPKKQ